MQLLVDAGFHDFGGLPPQMFGKYYDNNTYHDKISKKITRTEQPTAEF